MTDFNPFNPNSVVVPTLFAGRHELVSEISRKLSYLKRNQPASFYIFGERGIGKTALAKLIRATAAGESKQFGDLKLITSYYSVEPGQDIASVLQAGLNRMTDQMPQSLVDRVGTRLGEVFKNGKFSIGAFGASLGVEPNIPAEVRQATVKDQVVSILGNLLKVLADDNTSDGTDGALIIIDETHNIKDLSAAASILRGIITTLDVEGRANVSFMLIGYEQDADRFFAGDSSARRTFDSFELQVMPDTEAAEVLKKGFDLVSLRYDDAQILRLVGIAGGYPHSIQILGHNLVAANTDDLIDAYDWSNAINASVVELQRKEFATMFSFGRPRNEKDKVLIIMAGENRPMSRSELASISGTANIYQTLKPLRQNGAVKEDADKNFTLQSQLFRSAILFDEAVRKAVSL